MENASSASAALLFILLAINKYMSNFFVIISFEII